MKWRRRRKRKRRQSHLAKRSLKKISRRMKKIRRRLTKLVKNKKLPMVKKLVHRRQSLKRRSKTP